MSNLSSKDFENIVYTFLEDCPYLKDYTSFLDLYLFIVQNSKDPDARERKDKVSKAKYEADRLYGFINSFYSEFGFALYDFADYLNVNIKVNSINKILKQVKSVFKRNPFEAIYEIDVKDYFTTKLNIIVSEYKLDEIASENDSLQKSLDGLYKTAKKYDLEASKFKGKDKPSFFIFTSKAAKSIKSYDDLCEKLLNKYGSDENTANYVMKKISEID